MNQSICSCPQTPAMATVPVQDWCEPYELETALIEGTLFPCLNLTFYKAPPSSGQNRICPKPVSTKEHDRECRMKEIYEVSFAINDLTLYLDTHPNCPKGTKMYYELLEKRMQLLADFAASFYPLTAISMITGNCNTDKYGWPDGPMPWEGACI